MILLTLYIAISSHPPIATALIKSFAPDIINTTSIITLVGGTVGGYISFAGAHRLLDAGVTGVQQMPQINKSAVSGIVITGIMRCILFLAILGVVMQNTPIDAASPTASVFKIAAGNLGYKFFGVVMWIAAITSLVGASYTSYTFIKTWHPLIENNQRTVISVLIILSTILFILNGKPIKLMVAAGTVNGFILPVTLSVILFAAHKKSKNNSFKNPVWLSIAGWLVVAILTIFCIKSITG
jgi:Mn2+/Fe2+ NRAMP family transporter